MARACVLPPVLRVLRSAAAGFLRQTRGAATVLSLFWVLILLVLGALAIDAAQAWRVRAILQAAADASAHAAAVRLSEPKSGETPRQAAERVLNTALGVTHLTGTLAAGDFQLGHWSSSNGFTTTTLTPDAVRITLRRSQVNANPEPTYLLSLVNFRFWNIEASSIGRVTRSTAGGVVCPSPLLSLEARADIGTPLAYLGVCVYAKAAAYVSTGNSVIARNSYITQLVNGLLIQTAGLPSYSAALPKCTLVQKLTGCVDPYVFSAVNLNSLVTTAASHVDATITASSFEASLPTAGRSYYVTCTDRDVLYIPSGSVLQNLVIMSDCPVKVGVGVKLYSTVIVGNLKARVTSDPLALNVVMDRQPSVDSPCAPRGGIMVLVFVDADIQATVPSLLQSSSPMGNTLNQLVTQTGGLLSGLLNLTGSVLSSLTSSLTSTLNSTTTALGLPGICVGAQVMLTGDTVTLALAE